MGFLSRALAERKSLLFDDPSVSVLSDLFGGRPSRSGVEINLTSSLRVSAAFACLKVLSQGCAQVPFKLFREEEKDGLKAIQAAKDHPLYDMAGTMPNDWTTSFEFRETLIIHAALGNAYVFVNRGAGGKILELILLQPSMVTPLQLSNYSTQYTVTGVTGQSMTLPSEAIWHIKGPSWTGSSGLDILSLAREALGLAVVTEESHARLHAKGVRPSGMYSVDGTLSPEQYKALKTWIEKEYAGADNAGAPMILDRGAKWLSQAMTGVDAQHIETRKFQIEEVCRFFGVFPQMVFSTDKTSTFASAEAFFDAHIKHSLGPWFARIENSADVNLLTRKERAQGLYFKFVAAGLLRGSVAERSAYYSAALGAGGSPGWMTPDEVRALEELNPMGGNAGELPPGAAASGTAAAGSVKKPVDPTQPPEPTAKP